MMTGMNAAKASNAVVAVVDFYSGAVADLLNQLSMKDAAIRQLTEQMRSSMNPHPAIKAAERELIPAACALADAFGDDATQFRDSAAADRFLRAVAAFRSAVDSMAKETRDG